MQHWKRKILNAGVSLSVVGGGVLLAEGAASAHDGVDHDGAVHHGIFHRQVQGVVASLGTDSFTITTHQGVTKTIDTTSTTVFSETGTPVAPATVAVGQDVVVSLDPTNPTTPTALRVVIVLNRVSGKVLDVSGTSITLSGRHNSTRVVMVSAGTMYFSGTTTETGATVGEFVTAFGTADSTTPTEFDAQFVDIFVVPPHSVTPVVPPAVPNPNPGFGRGDDHGDHDNLGDHDNDGDHDNNGDGNDNDGPEPATTPTVGAPHAQPTAPVTTQPAPAAPNTVNGDGGSGPGPSNGGSGQGGQSGHGDNGGGNGGGSSDGGSGSGGHGGRG